MAKLSMRPKSIRLHLTNVTGMGATQLMQSLLPSLERSSRADITMIYLPDHGILSSYTPEKQSISLTQYRRILPNALSRMLECTLLSSKFSGDSPLIVFGDLPLYGVFDQIIFVQNSHLLVPKKFQLSMDWLKFAIARKIFQINSRFARAFIVQTNFMYDELLKSYPGIVNKLHIIPQPVPTWLLGNAPPSIRCFDLIESGLRLIYPAANYPHKNHKLLTEVDPKKADDWPVRSLKITLDSKDNPAPKIGWIDCVGLLDSRQMVQMYCEADALLFLSTNESYGFPLIEAMYMELAIICPDLPYARAMCGNGAIYFDPLSIHSLQNAVYELQSKLQGGWRPDWSKQLKEMPQSWDEVGETMINVAIGVNT
jgi:glycosyltransferase involved in cell wall biosynthesis